MFKIKEYFQLVLSYRGKEIYDTRHSVNRFFQRVPTTSISIYNNLLRKAIDYLFVNGLENEEDHYIFIDKKHDFGIQLDWREDTKKFNIIQGFTATTLGVDELNYFMKSDKAVFLEQIKEYADTLEEANQIFKKGYYRLSSFKNLKDEMKGYNIFIDGGDIYKTFEIIEL